MTPLPMFGGTKGPEITKSIVDIQDSFQTLVASLRGISYNILDVKATRWHDDFNKFKVGALKQQMVCPCVWAGLHRTGRGRVWNRGKPVRVLVDMACPSVGMHAHWRKDLGCRIADGWCVQLATGMLDLRRCTRRVA